MIILTLFTFMEGFQTLFMLWLSAQTMKFYTAIFTQMLLTGGLTFLLILTLTYVSKKYSPTRQQKSSPYLYTLLFPCIFLVWVIRSGLKLDMWTHSDPVMIPSFEQSNLWALMWILGACVIFFILLRLVNKILSLSIQEIEQKQLEDQVQKQSQYLEEAKKRTEQYRRFQHDIDNHFLVLSGLIHEKKYEEAEKYFDKLHNISDNLLIRIETGNPAVDILLSEKINFARSNGIQIAPDIQLPPDCFLEDIDLCIILANALDNAIKSCLIEKIKQPEISITARTRHYFLLIEIINPVKQRIQPLKYGTGLKNIKYIVEKYQGTLRIENSETLFKLTLLLCIKPLAKEE